MCFLKFADGGLLVVTSDIVPLDSVSVEVVENSQAHLGLVDVTILGLVTVVRLRSLAPGTVEIKKESKLILLPLKSALKLFCHCKNR